MDKGTNFQTDLSNSFEHLSGKIIKHKRRNGSGDFEYDKSIVNSSSSFSSNKKTNKFINLNEMRLNNKDIQKNQNDSDKIQNEDQYRLSEIKSQTASEFSEDDYFSTNDNREKESEAISNNNKSQNDSFDKQSTIIQKSSSNCNNKSRLNGSGKMSRPNNGKTIRSKKTKGRVKINMEFIENKIRRYTTFSKRKTGIMKKAYELSTLTGTQVMLLVASETGHVYTFATNKLQPMITSEVGKNLIQSCLSYHTDEETANSSNFENSKISIENINESDLRLDDEDDDLDSTTFDNVSEEQ